MSGVPYISPRKAATARKSEFVDLLSTKRRGVSKVSEKRARAEPEKPALTPIELLARFKEEMADRNAELAGGGTTVQPTGGHSHSYDGDYSEFGDVGPMEDIESGYSADIDEEDSFDNMPIQKIRELVKEALQMHVDGARKSTGTKRSYSQNMRRYKENWKEFVDCVTGELAWTSFGPSINSVCDCRRTETLPAISLSGTNLI